MNEFQRDFDWQAGFVPAIKAIVGPHLLDVAPFEIDAKQATDFLVLKADPMYIACRLRRPKHFDKYRGQFTIRSFRPSGAETEFAKIQAGFADWMLYGYGAANDCRVFGWMLIDLDVFRREIAQPWPGPGKIEWGEKPNLDGTRFYWYEAKTFPRAMIIASGGGVS